MMADNELLLQENGVGGGDDIFVYTGGEQRVPRDVKRVRIADNIDTILAETFRDCQQLIEVEGHKKIKKIKTLAFYGCPQLRWVKKMTGLIEIEEWAYFNCPALSELKFDKLEIIGEHVFYCCKSLRSVNMPSIRRVGENAFRCCAALTDVVFGVKLERIEEYAFFKCTALRRIVIPLKDNLIIGNSAFHHCGNFSRVDTLAGGIHDTISYLHMERWRNEMEEEINSINQTLPNIGAFYKTGAIQHWITRVFSRMEYDKTEHEMLIKEAMTLLELALWKAKLLNEADEKKKCNVDGVTKKAKIDTEAARKEHRVTCGASIVVKNVLPFLTLK